MSRYCTLTSLIGQFYWDPRLNAPTVFPAVPKHPRRSKHNRWSQFYPQTLDMEYSFLFLTPESECSVCFSWGYREVDVQHLGLVLDKLRICQHTEQIINKCLYSLQTISALEPTSSWMTLCIMELLSSKREHSRGRFDAQYSPVHENPCYRGSAEIDK